MVVMTVPAKKKELPRSHRLDSLEGMPDGLTPALIADTTCYGRKENNRVHQHERKRKRERGRADKEGLYCFSQIP